jgi:hypothetical protein
MALRPIFQHVSAGSREVVCKRVFRIVTLHALRLALCSTYPNLSVSGLADHGYGTQG